MSTPKKLSPEPPNYLDAERYILGAILNDNQYYAEAAESLLPDDFYLDSHRRIFLRMGELVDKSHGVDIVTLTEYLKRLKEIDSVGGWAYVTDLTTGISRRPYIKDYIAIVKEKAQLRRLIKVCTQSAERAYDQQDEAKEIARTVWSELKEIFAAESAAVSVK